MFMNGQSYHVTKRMVQIYLPLVFGSSSLVWLQIVCLLWLFECVDERHRFKHFFVWAYVILSTRPPRDVL